MKHLFFLSLMLISCLSYAQDDFNFEVISNVTYPEGGNDIWGYVADDGTEYAVVGTVDNTRIYSLADHSAPVEVKTITGATTTWRDMKSYKDHIYVTADNAPDGVVIIDMSQAPDSISFRFWNPPITSGGVTESLTSCHNLYIDKEDGYMYLAGCSIENGNKAIIYDLNTDRSNPKLVGVYGGDISEYAHDLMVQDNVMYSSQIYKGAIVLYDVTDKTDIKYLGEAPTSFDFTHNAWVSTDGNYVFTTDERANAFVDAYDISDYNNIKRIDKFQSLETANRGVIPHNTHYFEGYLITSWYTDGVVITDAARPDNLIKVGSFDTWLGADGDFRGCWGAYPYLPSGHILANDRTSGLYVLKPDYIRGCYLEGLVTDAGTGEVINGVQVQIITDELNESITNSVGEYKTGLATAGTYSVLFTHPEYEDRTFEAVLENGVLTVLDVKLGRPPLTISGLMVESGSNNPIKNGVISIETADRTLSAKSDDAGQFTIYAYPEEHNIIAASWGYLHKELDFSPDGDEELIIEMDFGYMDDFVLDQGWKVEGDANGGIWERAVPVATEFVGEVSNIGADVEGDIGNYAYVTGNGGGDARDDDVDNGATVLVSPAMDLSSYSIPIIEFRTYFYNAGGNDLPNDNLQIIVSDGDFRITREIKENTITWTDKMTINLEQLAAQSDLDLAKPITFSLIATDVPGSNLLECALDVFRVVEGEPSSISDLIENNTFRVFPNPSSDMLNIETEIMDISGIEMLNSLGQKVYSAKKLGQIDVSDYKSGTYLISLVRANGDKISSKVVIK